VTTLANGLIVISHKTHGLLNATFSLYSSAFLTDVNSYRTASLFTTGLMNPFLGRIFQANLMYVILLSVVYKGHTSTILATKILSIVVGSSTVFLA
jgi:hypothetical protein